MSSTSVVYPIIGALQEAIEFLNSENGWEHVSDKQKDFLEKFNSLGVKDLDKINEIQSKSSYDVNTVNSFLKENKFDIQLTEESAKGSFYVASILKVLVEWIKEGKKIDLIVGDKTYPAVKLEECKVLEFDNHDNPVVLLETKSGDKVYMTKTEPLKDFEILDFIFCTRKNPAFAKFEVVIKDL